MSILLLSSRASGPWPTRSYLLMPLVYTLAPESTLSVDRACTFPSCWLTSQSNHTALKRRSRRRSLGFPYIRIDPATSSRISAGFFFLCHKLVELLIQPLFNFFLRRVAMARHHTSLRQIPVLATKPFVGLMGPDPGSEVI